MEQKDFFSQIKGSQSLSFQKPPYILASGNVVGKKEGEGPLGKEFDVICEDDKFGADNWEDAESTLQKDAIFRRSIRTEYCHLIWSDGL